MMASFDKLANQLFGGKRAETNSVLHDGETHTLIGTATGDSADGSVMVELSSDVTNPEPIEIDGETYYSDADTSVELPTTTSVQEGDEVLVSVYGGTPLRSPVVTGVVGSGDRVAGMAQDAYDLADSVEGIAQQALDVANATGQHFWSDTDGAHVTEVTQEEWTDPTDPGYQSGPNSLWNSLGMLFRDGLNNLLANVAGQNQSDSFTIVSEQTRYALDGDPTEIVSVTIGGTVYADGELVSDITGNFYRIDYFDSMTYAGQTLEISYRTSSALTLYDGEGNTSADIVASFSAHVIELGRAARDAIIKLLDGALYIRATNNGTDADPRYIGNIVSGYGLELVSRGASDTGQATVSLRGSKDSADTAFGQVTIDVAGDTDSATIILDAKSGSTLQLAAASATSLASGTVTIAQAIISLTRPMATWTGTSGTVSDGAGWHQTDFNTMLAQHGPWSDYFTLSGGRITALKDVTLQLTMDLSWNDNVLGIRGAGFFKNSAVGSGVNEISSFSAKSANNRFYCVFPPRLITLNAGEYLNIGRYNQLANSIFTRGTNYTWLTVEVIG